MPTSAFHSEQGTVTLVPVASLTEESRCPCQAARVCWTVDRVRVTSSSPLSRVSSDRVRLIVFDDDVKKDMVPVFSCFVRSLQLKCEACNSKTRYLQAQPATPRAMWHPRPLADDVLCKKAS